MIPSPAKRYDAFASGKGGQQSWHQIQPQTQQQCKKLPGRWRGRRREAILIRGGAHLEAAGRIDAVALDKTGTVTSGKPVVVEVLSKNGFSERDVLRLAGVAEKRSEHPVPRTIVAAAAAELGDVPDPDEFSSSRGFGVTARAGADEIAVGSGRHIAAARIEVGAELTDMPQQQRANGNAAAFVGVNGRLAGIGFVANALRDHSGDMIGALDEMGTKHIVLLTGDASPVARRVADQVGIREVRAEMLPENTIAETETLSGHPHRVAMVGDGVNDAPPLATADLGIAMGPGGVDLAIDAADVALMGDDVGKIPTTLGLGRRAPDQLAGRDPQLAPPALGSEVRQVADRPAAARCDPRHNEEPVWDPTCHTNESS